MAPRRQGLTIRVVFQGDITSGIRDDGGIGIGEGN